MDLLPFQSVWAALAIAAVGVWCVSLVLKDASIADIVWGLGFLFLAILYARPHRPLSPRGSLVLLMVVAWSVRLATHLLWRNWGRGEDPRYAAMRANWGKNFWWVSLFTVFGLQAALMWVISAPLYQSMNASLVAPLGWVGGVGVLLWVVGMYFESVADWQLLRFKSDPDNKGKVLESGLWRYSRHPNYFGEFLIWWGFFLIAAETVGGIWTVVSPLVVSYLLLRVSGVPMLDQLLRRTKGDYRHYIERTNAFFPWFPK